MCKQLPTYTGWALADEMTGCHLTRNFINSLDSISGGIYY